VVNQPARIDEEIHSAQIKPSLKKGSFLTDVLKVSTGTIIAQVLLVLIAPILTRLFDPEDFGLAALFVSLSAIIGVIVCLRYELSIMLPDTDEEASNLLALSLVLALVVSIVSFVAFYFGQNLIVTLINSPQIRPYLYFIPLSVFFVGSVRALNYWNSRRRQFGRLSVSKVINSISTGSVQLSTGFGGLASGGSLIFAYVLGWVVSSLYLGARIWVDDSKLFIKNVNWRKIISGLGRYKKFPLLSSWSGLFNSLSVQTPTLLLAAFFSPIEVGFYALGYRVLRMPLDLIGSAVAQVFYQRASEAKRQGNLGLVVIKVFRRLVSLGMFPLLLVTVIGRDLFIFAFGENWAEAGVYMQILALWTFFVFISNPIGTLVNTLEKQEISLIFNIVLFVTRLVSLVIGGLLGNVFLALVLFSLSGVFSWMWFCIWLLNNSGVPLYKTAQIFVENLALSSPFLILMVIITYYTGTSVIAIVLIGVVMIGLYYVAALTKDKELLMFIRQTLEKYWTNLKIKKS
jgi:lipopolysaccharide exporter